MYLYPNFCKEAFDDNGVLCDFTLDYPDNYNFGYDVVDEMARIAPSQRAMVWCNTEGDHREFTFDDISRLSNRAANVFRANGVKKGDKVLVILKRNYEYWYVAPALHKLGAIMIPATHMLTVDDLVCRCFYPAIGIGLLYFHHISSAASSFHDICQCFTFHLFDEQRLYALDLFMDLARHIVAVAVTVLFHAVEDGEIALGNAHNIVQGKLIQSSVKIISALIAPFRIHKIRAFQFSQYFICKSSGNILSLTDLSDVVHFAVAQDTAYPHSIIASSGYQHVMSLPSINAFIIPPNTYFIK